MDEYDNRLPPPRASNPPYRQDYGPPPPQQMDQLYREDFVSPPKQVNPPYRQNQDYSLPQQMGPSYREEYYPPPQQMDPSYREDHGPMPPPPSQRDLPYQREYDPLPQHMNPPHGQEYGPPPQDMPSSYRDGHAPLPPQMGPSYREEQGPLLLRMDPSYRQEQGPPPLRMGPNYRQEQGPSQHHMDPTYKPQQGDPSYRNGYGPPPQQHTDQPYQHEYGPPPPQQMDPSFQQEYGPPPPQQMGPPPNQQEYGPPPPQQINRPYQEDYGPPPPQQMDRPYQEEYGPPPPQQMDRPYHQEHGPPPPQQIDPSLNHQEYGPPPQQQMDRPYHQEYGPPPPPQQTDRPYQQEYGPPPPPQQMDLPYRQEYDPPLQQMNDQSPLLPDEIDSPYRNELNPSLQKSSHHQYPSGPYNVKENGVSDRRLENINSQSQPKTLEDALKVADINLPRLVVLPSTAPAKPKWGDCGLPNLGQTSYLSTVMQCLSHTPPLARYFVAKEFLEDVVEKESAKGSQLVKAVADLIIEMDRGQAKMGTLAFLKGVCGRMNEKYAGTGQRDAYDLLTSLLQWLHKNLASGEAECACTKNSSKKRTTKDKSKVPANDSGLTKSSGQPQQSPALNPRKPGNNPNQQHQYHQYPPSNQSYPPDSPSHKMSSKLSPASSASNNVGKKCKKCGLKVEPSSVISDIFEGIHRSNIICPVSGVIISSLHDRFLSLSLPLTYPGDAPLEEALEHYYRIRAIDWDCPYCGYQHLCHQQMRILFSPKVLVLHLNRYNEDGRSSKLTRVMFPTNEFSLGDYMTPGWKGRSKELSLYGICNLHGRGNTSHYTTCCRSNKYNQGNDIPWILFDDDKVQLIERFKNPREAHILFYRIEEEDK